MAIATSWFVIASVFIAHKSGWLQLAAMLVSLPYMACFFYSVFEMFRGWRSHKTRALIPLAACVGAWFGAFTVGAFAQRQLFLLNLPKYQAIVSSVDVESLPLGEKAESLALNSEAQKLVYVANAERTQDGALLVELLTEGGFPVKHSGYVFSSSGNLPAESIIRKRWPHIREVQPKWFRVAD